MTYVDHVSQGPFPGFVLKYILQATVKQTMSCVCRAPSWKTTADLKILLYLPSAESWKGTVCATVYSLACILALRTLGSLEWG